MKPETRDLMKEALVRWNQTAQNFRSKVEKKFDLTPVKKTAINLYLASPTKLQYVLARWGIRMVVKKKKQQIQQFMRH